MYEGIFGDSEVAKLVALVNDLRAAGKRGQFQGKFPDYIIYVKIATFDTILGEASFEQEYHKWRYATRWRPLHSQNFELDSLVNICIQIKMFSFRNILIK